MIAPLESVFELGHLVNLLVALALGVAFGFLLERAGLGDAPRLAGLFYLRDFTVLRVMFAAIVTALLGLFWCARVGLLDLTEVHLEATYVVPQLVGGMVFGIGFVLAGLCPGTSCVAAVTGKLDGVATVLGIVVGVLIFGETFQGFSPFLYSTRVGPQTLVELSGAPLGILALVVVVIATAAFVASEVKEGARLGEVLPRAVRHPLRSGKARLAWLALALGAGAVVAGDPSPPPWSLRTAPPAGTIAGTQAHYLDPIELATWVVEKRDNFRVLDLRARTDFDSYHIPGAEPRPDGTPQPLPRNEVADNAAPVGDVGAASERAKTVVVYVAGDAVPHEALATLGSDSARRVYLLWGGTHGWATRVLFPNLARARTMSPADVERLARFSRYFNGRPRMPVGRMELPAGGFRREGC